LIGARTLRQIAPAQTLPRPVVMTLREWLIHAFLLATIAAVLTLVIFGQF
jgi:hypothetical protein